MTQNEFIDNIHKRLSIISVGASALRNQGAPGIVKTARDYFYKSIILDDFFKVLQDPLMFRDYLDNHTNNLLMEFEPAGRNWGAARKGLNLFFRELTYNKFISDHYKLPIDVEGFNDTIKYLEVPLDNDVAKGIIRNAKLDLPKWVSIKSLTKEKSDQYQFAALAIAEDEMIARVHLDLKYWRDSLS
jgi:hypothetical protein